MDVSSTNNTPSRGQALPKPSDAGTGTQGQVTASAEWSFTPGPYDQRGYYIAPPTAVRPANATAQGPSSANGPTRQPPAASSTRVTVPGNTAAGPTQHDQRITNVSVVMVYLSIAGPPLRLPHDYDGTDSQPARWWSHRAKLSAMWLRPSVRAVLWANPETRLELIRSYHKPHTLLSVEEAKRVRLNDVCMAIQQDLTQDTFWKHVRILYSNAPGSPYHVSEWAIRCATCGTEVVGYASDSLWIERYLAHRKNVCGQTPDGRRA